MTRHSMLQPGLGLLFLLSLGAAAQAAEPVPYKIISPDGKITYTDQPPADTTGRVIPLSGRASAQESAPSPLPPELRDIASRFPVTLFAGKDCKPCETGRQLLTQRGIPFTEKRVDSPADLEAFTRLSGDGLLPMLSIGRQQLKGLSSEWLSYLDAAGYPSSSKLPPGYKAPPATPLAVSAATTIPADARRPQAPLPSEAVPEGNVPGVRF